MKTTNLILILIVVVSLMSCKNQMHVVTLYVDTANIIKNSIDEYANFNQPKGISNEDFTIHVRKGDLVIWNALSISDEPVEVNITAIIDEPGPRDDDPDKKYVNFFDGKTLSPDKIKTRTVIGTLKNGKPGDIQKYKLHFTVKDKVDTFIIDPKMEMN